MRQGKGVHGAIDTVSRKRGRTGDKEKIKAANTASAESKALGRLWGERDETSNPPLQNSALHRPISLPSKDGSMLRVAVGDSRSGHLKDRRKNKSL